MNAYELLAWITRHYGQPKVTHGEHWTATVPVLRGKATGVGSSEITALYDLYCDLVLPSGRLPVHGIHREQWEIDRRNRIDAGLVSV